MNTIAMIIGYGTIGVVVIGAVLYGLLYLYAKHLGMPD